MTCRGRGTVHGTVKETINIPKGVDSGVNLRVSKKGHAGSGGPSGDLIINIKVSIYNTTNFINLGLKGGSE